METFLKDWNEALMKIERSSAKGEDKVADLGKSLEKYLEKAKEVLKKKNGLNPRPNKRFARIVENESEEETVPASQPEPIVSKPAPENGLIRTSSEGSALRPTRTAKIHASKNLKEPPANLKMRNDNNMTVIVKLERLSGSQLPRSSNSSSRDSLKENARPSKEMSKDDIARRSQSVEIIPTKPVEIDMTQESQEDSNKMPPPPLPAKQKKAKGKKVEDVVVDPTQPLPLRVTRSKIKKEKVSDKGVQEEAPIVPPRISESAPSVLQKTVDTTAKPKKAPKKYPMPIIVKVERLSEEIVRDKPEKAEKVQEACEVNNETFNLPPPVINETITLAAPTINNETITIAPHAINNETVTLETAPINETVTLEKNAVNDSLMTEDNDEEEENASMNVPLSKLPPPPTLQAINAKKKNEVFNPFMASPVKKKVEAFEKHAMEVRTPEKGRVGVGASSSALKYNVLRSGTPSKIATYSVGGSKGTTPMSSAKQKYMAAVTTTSSASSASSSKSLTKKYSSMSNENQEDLKKAQEKAQLEEKKRLRDEKIRKVQEQKEANERKKVEAAMQQQKEREEKFKKYLAEKDEKQRMEAAKKKLLKEQQEKKYAEERTRKEEAAAAAAQAQRQTTNKDESLHNKMQKQILLEKQHSQQRKEAAQKKVLENKYDFDMLHTDDSTDDEARPSKKRPPVPSWSKKHNRREPIRLQTYLNSDLVDTLFSVQPVNVDLRQIFPMIESRKLARNSSAVWNTPPRYSEYQKTLDQSIRNHRH